MLHLIVLARLLAVAAGAVVGGWVAGTLYLRVVWAVLERRVRS